MTRWNFIMDENMVVRGLLGRPPAARDIWLAIAHNCHRCAVDRLLYGRYWDHLRQSRGNAPSAEAALVAGTINLILRNADKTIWTETQAPTRLSQYVRHGNDKFLADIAAEVIYTHGADNCVLVSTDARTWTDFNRPEMQSIGIRGLRIEGGLALACEQCGG